MGCRSRVGMFEHGNCKQSEEDAVVETEVRRLQRGVISQPVAGLWASGLPRQMRSWQ